MDSKEEEMFLENIEEFVKDEGKIVTYKWLSKTLDIHVNAAKQLLYKFALVDDVKKADVYLTYVLGGMLNEGCGAKIQVCRETELDQVKSQFKVVNFEHIYSVQKIENIPDFNIFYGVDHLQPEQTSEERLGAITCTRAVQRRGSDIAALRDKAIAATAVATKVPAFVSKKPAVTVVKPQDVKTADVKTADVKTVEPEKPKTIASMFSAQTKKQPENIGKTPVVSNAAKKGKSGGIASFFPKQTEKPKPAANSIETPTVEVSSPEASSHVGKHDKHVVETSAKSTKSTKSDPIDEKPVSKSPAKNEATIKTPASRTNSKEGKRKKKKSSERKPEKKRKRIMVMSDSDSEDDDMFGKDDDDDEVRPPSPDLVPEEETPFKCDSSDEDVIPATPVVSGHKGSGKIRIRTRKLVDKTYEDEDGYVVTKKEMVYESCSDDETTKNKKEETSVVKKETTKSKQEEGIIDVEVKDEIVSNSKNNTSKAKVTKEEEVIDVSNEKKDKKRRESKDQDAKDNKRKKKGEPKEEDSKERKAKKGDSQDEEDVIEKKSKKQKRESKGGEGEEDSPAVAKKAKRKKKEAGGESQEEEDEKLNKKKAPKKKASPPASKGKQQTLMSFFSKK